MPLYEPLPEIVRAFVSRFTSVRSAPIPAPVDADLARSPHRPVARILAVIVAAVVAIVTTATVFALPASAASSVARIAGDDRVDTAVTASQTAFDAASNVVVTTSEDYPDALAAAAYAAEHAAPILLTGSDSLSASVAEEIRRLGADTVTILGGDNVISPDVEDTVRSLVPNVVRIAGETRYETAELLAGEVGPGTGGRIALALGIGTDAAPGWADALSAGSLAATDDPIPTLLTTTDDLPPATVRAIEQLQPSEILILGGPAAISEQVEGAVADLGPATRRLAGANRYRTSVAVATEAFDAGVPRDDLVFVSGENFPDALSAAGFAANEDAPMLLVPSERLADGVDEFVRSNYESFDDGLLIGGTNAVDDFVEAEIVAALQGEARPTPPPPPAPEPEPQAVAEPEKPSYNGYTFRFDLAIWDRLADCESSGNWSINTGNGYYGGIQFSLASWRAVGGSGYPHQASRLEQIYRGEKLQAIQGWGAWPACSRKIGLR